jgi:hypothetical protein
MLAVFILYPCASFFKSANFPAAADPIIKMESVVFSFKIYIAESEKGQCLVPDTEIDRDYPLNQVVQNCEQGEPKRMAPIFFQTAHFNCHGSPISHDIGQKNDLMP